MQRIGTIKILAVAALAFTLGAGSAVAQSLRDVDGPTETPPSSYTGKQYVDSKGCVFVRAGYAGTVKWVPRVNRRRNLLCGFAPTFAKNTAPTSPAPKPVPTAAPRVVAALPVPAVPRPVIVDPAPKPTRTAAVAPPVRRVVSAPARTPATAVPVRSRPVATVAPVRVTPPVVAKPVVAPAPAPVRTRTTACSNLSPLAQKYMTTTSGFAVRCGPQVVNPGASRDGALLEDRGTPPVGAARIATAPKIAPPTGYRAAFEDDRLNPHRGERTAEGNAQSRLIWTNTVPRRLLDVRRGHDVTRNAPVARTVVATKTLPTGRTLAPVRAKAPTRVAVAPARSGYVAPAGHRYVQVGMFGSEANARNSAARLQGLGLPVRVGTYQKAGKSYKIVLAGPFSNASGLSAGLSAARRAGFSDAFTRK